MRRLENPRRIRRLIETAIREFGLDLSGLSVLTEAASGPFVVTALAAALAGAEVFAVTRSSSYGSATEVLDYCREWACQFDVEDRIVWSDEPPISFADRADIVTNLGFIRPITSEFIQHLPPHTVIPLMWEPWEFRSEDIDLPECRRRSIPVVGTRETHSLLQIFDYLGAASIKLLFEGGLEVVRNRIGVIATDPFGSAITKALSGVGASVLRLDASPQIIDLQQCYGHLLGELDALVLAEHRIRRELIGNSGGLSPAALQHEGIAIAHIAGNIDHAAMEAAGLGKMPSRLVPHGYMTVTTDYAGPRPVIDLHVAGLRVGEILVRARLAGASVNEAEALAVQSGLGLLLDEVPV